MNAVSVIVYERCADVVWRLGPDRVLVRHATSTMTSLSDDDAAADLSGTAALIWVALDEPASTDEIVARMAAEGLDRTVEEIAEVAGQLVVAGWLRTASALGV